MKALVMFDRDDTGLTIGDITWDDLHDVATMTDHTGDWVAGATLTDVGGGKYILDAPLVLEEATFGIHITADPNTYCDGMFSADDVLSSMVEPDGAVYRFTANALEQGPQGVESQLIQAIYNYITGQVAKGTIITPLASITTDQAFSIYQYTSYENPGEIQIVIGPDFSSWLDGSCDVYFTASKTTSQVTPDIEATCSIYDQANGILKLALTVDDTSVDPGTYRWQIKLVNGNGAVSHISADSKLYVKPMLKKPA